MHVTFIANPIAGAKSHRFELQETMARLRQAGIGVTLRTTRGPGDAEKLAREASATSQAVVAAGGDGTVRDVACGLAGGATPLMVWPGGTENLVAKMFGFRASCDSFFATLTAGTPVKIDMGRAGEQAFLVVGGVGFDAEIVSRLTHIRKGHITHLTYAEPIWRTFWQYKFPPIRVTGDDWEWQGRGMIFIGNMWRYSMGLPVVRDAVWDDGLLDVIMMPCRNQIDLVGHSLRTLCRRHVEHHSVIYKRVKRVRIESDHRVPYQLDGDNGGYLPLEISVEPQALRVQVPPSLNTR